jgi:Rieske Fe-S protein
MSQKISRRRFLIASGAAGGVLLLTGFGALELSDPTHTVWGRIKGEPLTQLPQIENAWTYKTGTLTLDLVNLPELDTPGGAVRIEGAILPDPILVFQGDDSNYYSFKNVCPHAGRMIDPMAGTLTLECCSASSSTFDYDGTVLSGPATEPLASYPVSVLGDSLVIVLN